MRKPSRRFSLRGLPGPGCLIRISDGETPIPYPVAEVLVIALAVHGVVGLAFAVLFAWRGAGVLDPAAQGGTWGFRLLILPGVAALWPLMWLKWRRGARARESAP